MPVVVDALGRRVEAPDRPRRVVSLVPSQTETLFDLGLDEEIAGVTRFCVRPADRVKTKANVGGTKDFRAERIAQLDPDLIVANKEENTQEGIERLAARWPVWVSDVVTVDDALATVRAMGELVGRARRGEELARECAAALDAVPDFAGLRVAYLIWRKPWMAAGGGTFIDSLLRRAGMRNAFGERARYPEISIDELRAPAVETVLLSSEPFPFKEKHAEELREALGGGPAVELVDGEAFSWHGTRMREAGSALSRVHGRLR